MTTVTVNEEIRHIVIEDENSVTVVLSSVFAGTGEGGGASALAQLSDVDNAGVAAKDDVLTAKGDGSFTFKPTQIPDHSHPLPDHEHPAPSYEDITNKPVVFPADPATIPDTEWTDVQGKPITFPADPHTHPFGDLENIPDQFPPTNHNHDFGDIFGMPQTYPPSEHTHPAPTWIEVTNKPDVFPADPATVPTPLWDAIQGKPALFPPVEHTHPVPSRGIYHIPCPPPNPSVYDDEFNDGVLDGKWTQWNISGTATFAEGLDGADFGSTGASAGWVGLLQNPPPDMYWTAIAKFVIFGTGALSVGLGCLNSAGNLNIARYIVNAATSNFTTTYGTPPSPSSSSNAMTVPTYMGVVYLRADFRNNGASSNQAQWISFDGESWINNSRIGKALGADITQWGPMVLPGQYNIARLKFLRVITGQQDLIVKIPAGTI